MLEQKKSVNLSIKKILGNYKCFDKHMFHGINGKKIIIFCTICNISYKKSVKNAIAKTNFAKPLGAIPMGVLLVRTNHLLINDH